MKLRALIILLFAVNISFSQDWTALRQAFQKSYELERQGEFQKAADELLKVYDQNSYEINLRLGWLNYNAGLFDKSASYYRRAIQLRPYSEEARFGLALPLSATGKWDEIIKLYNEILKNSPGNTTALYRLGLIYYGRKDYQKALQYFQKLVDLYPFGYDGLLMLAWTNLQLGKAREAKVLFNKVLLLSPNDKSALEGLSYLK